MRSGSFGRSARSRKKPFSKTPGEDAEVYRVIREELGDFDRYLASIGRYLAAELS
jgi:hypothetical protein